MIANIDQSDIEEVFEWVADESDIHIERLPLESSEVQNTETIEVAADGEKLTGTQATALVPQANLAALNSETATNPQPAGVETTPAINTAKTASSGGHDTTIRVSIEKIDQLINMVGELVITQSMLGQVGENFDLDRISSLQEGLGQL